MCTSLSPTKESNIQQTTPTSVPSQAQNNPQKPTQEKKSQKRRRGTKPPENVLQEISQRWLNGEPTGQLLREYSIPSTTFYRELQRLNPETYKKIMNERHPRRHMPIQQAWTRLENGESTRKIAATYGMTHHTLKKKLVRFDKERYQKIMSKRGRRYVIPLSDAWTRLEDWETLDKIAWGYGIPPETLRHRLLNADRNRYMRIRRERKLGTISPDILFRRLADGESVTRLAREYGMYYEKMRRTFLRLDKVLYEDIIDRTRTIKAEGYGYEDAKKEGADSDFELQVKRILDNHNIRYCSPTLRLGKHRYFPDFMTTDGTIIEAAGVTNRDYWQRYKEKTANYAKYGYPALIVVPYNLRKRARDYLPHSNMIVPVWIYDFKKDPKKYLKILGSIGNVPIDGRLPLSLERLV